ncbi:unnamed protein product [Fraxinus pennsylvanica]|uniref:Uncharacterized protein n=1 Tax=Fraxinus pennsylvanica TaxID=56036 RepID=A0AAD1YV67_9LAMI|nr:unnamed protein product [Fraxinus pennsylvanica]
MAIYLSFSSLPSHRFNIHTKIADNGANRPSLVACSATPQKWTILEETSELSKPRQTILNEQSSKDEFPMEYEQKLKDVRELLKSEELENKIETLMLVDTIQRLGVDYHFQEEIEAVLQRHYTEATTSFDGYFYYSLHDLSLFFRLLREHGFFIPADIFNKFKGKDGVFEGKLKQDIRGLMELYEAAQLVTEGEDILDEAAKFSSQIVSNRLKHPYHKSIARFTAKKYIRDFQGISGWGTTLKELAKMDISRAQTANQQELIQISKTGWAVQVDDILELISSVATILRLWDDFGSAKDEQQDGNDGSYIECYVKENPGSTVEIARERVIDIISSEWKRLNKQCLSLNQNSASSSFTKASLNIARMVPLMYSYDDDQQLPVLEEFINSTLFDDTFLVHRP